MIRYPACFGVISFAAVIAAGCTDKPATRVNGRPDPLVRPVDVEFLTFETPELQERFSCFDAAARRFVNEKFDYQLYELGGSFVRAVWAKGIGFTEPVELRGPRESLRQIHRISVDTIVVPFPHAKSAALGIEVIEPDPDKWCVSFRYREATKQGVTGSGWGITFFRWDADRLGHTFPFRPIEYADEKITLPIRSYAVRDSNVGIESNLPVFNDASPVKDNFLRHLRSADVMRDRYLADLARLEGRVVAFIEEHKAHKIVYGEYQGDGIEPPEELVPLTPEEETLELDKAREYFATQSRLMREHHEAMYAAWRKSFPVERCWPELREKH